jgi:hypothetical protein
VLTTLPEGYLVIEVEAFVQLRGLTSRLPVVVHGGHVQRGSVRGKPLQHVLPSRPGRNVKTNVPSGGGSRCLQVTNLALAPVQHQQSASPHPLQLCPPEASPTPRPTIVILSVSIPASAMHLLDTRAHVPTAEKTGGRITQAKPHHCHIVSLYPCLSYMHLLARGPTYSL